MNALRLSMSPSARRRRGSLARVLAGLWLVLHVFMVAALPVADGLTDHRDAVVAHVEDTHGGDCPSSHGESCELCHFAQGATGIAATAPGLAALPVGVGAAAPFGSAATAVAASLRGVHGSRAPPALG